MTTRSTATMTMMWHLRRRRWTALGAAAAFALAGMLAGCFSERDETTGPIEPGECPALDVERLTGATVIAIRDFAFASDTVRVAPGTRVVWANCTEEGEAAHTATSDDGLWESGFMTRGDVFERTFDEPGEYPYHCEPHPFMTGVVIVE